MALNLDTRIPLLSVDPNFNPSKSFNDAADAAVKQQQMTISNRLEKMKADREMAQAEREAKRAEQYAQMFAAMKQGTPATMSEGTPATQSQYQFGQPEQTPGYNINDMLTGRVDPQAALGLLTQQPSNVTPGSPAVPPQELVPAVPGREPTVEDMMRMYGEASLGAGDFKEGIDAFKALGGYSKDMRPPAEKGASVISGGSYYLGPNGNAWVSILDPNTRAVSNADTGVKFSDYKQQKLNQDDRKIEFTIKQGESANQYRDARLKFDRTKWDSDAGYRKLKADTAAFKLKQLESSSAPADPETVDTMARIYRAGGKLPLGRGGFTSEVGQQVLQRFREIEYEEGAGEVTDAVVSMKLAMGSQSAYRKTQENVQRNELAAAKAVGHLRVAQDALAKLPNALGGKIPILNSAVNTLDKWSGNKAALEAAKALQAFTSEYERILIGAYGAQGLSVYGAKDAKTLLNIDMSPQQRASIIDNMLRDIEIAKLESHKNLEEQAAGIKRLSGGRIDPSAGGKAPAPTAAPTNAAKQAKLDAAVAAAAGNAAALKDLEVYARNNGLQFKKVK